MNLHLRKSSRRLAFSLLEVLLALAILGGALAVISQFVSLGARNAVATQNAATAQMLCETKVEEFTSGILVPEPGGPFSFQQPEYDSDWEYYVDVQPLSQAGLLELTVTVMQQQRIHPRPYEYRLVRWMRDPQQKQIDPFAELETMALETGALVIDENGQVVSGTDATGAATAGATTPMSATPMSPTQGAVNAP